MSNETTMLMASLIFAPDNVHLQMLYGFEPLRTSAAKLVRAWHARQQGGEQDNCADDNDCRCRDRHLDIAVQQPPPPISLLVARDAVLDTMGHRWCVPACQEVIQLSITHWFHIFPGSC